MRMEYLGENGVSNWNERETNGKTNGDSMHTRNGVPIVWMTRLIEKKFVRYSAPVHCHELQKQSRICDLECLANCVSISVSEIMLASDVFVIFPASDVISVMVVFVSKVYSGWVWMG